MSPDFKHFDLNLPEGYLEVPQDGNQDMFEMVVKASAFKEAVDKGLAEGDMTEIERNPGALYLVAGVAPQEDGTGILLLIEVARKMRRPPHGGHHDRS